MAETNNASVVASKRRSLQADTLATSVVILLLFTVVQRTIGFGRGILFCRWMSTESLGEWELAHSFLMLAAPLAVLGVPGSFGRYAEHYRQRGHLRTFLWRAAAWTVVCSGMAVLLMECFAPALSVRVFGSVDQTHNMRIISVCLVTIILHHTLTATLTALRLYRLVSAMNFVQSTLFAGIALALVWGRPEMIQIVYAYSAACLIASVGAMIWAWPALDEIERPQEPLPHGAFWDKLLRFAFFVWATNVLTHLFAIGDRYMLVHFAGFSAEEAHVQIGHYHTSRIVPMLMVSVAELFSGLIMPYLSHDWEIGRKSEVSARLNLAVKLTSLGMLLFGACVLAAGPMLFNVVLEGRFDEGLKVLPWTVAGCVLYSLYLVAQSYLWCAEKHRLQMAPLLVGLAANIVLNYLLLPYYGLWGCVLSAAAGSLVCLVSVMWLNRLHGMSVDRGAWVMAVVPMALGLGAWPAVAIATAVLVLCLTSNIILTAHEREQLRDVSLEFVAKGLSVIRSRRVAASA